MSRYSSWLDRLGWFSQSLALTAGLHTLVYAALYGLVMAAPFAAAAVVAMLLGDVLSKDRRWNPRASARGGRRRDFFRFSFAGNSLYAGCCSKGSCSRCAVR